MKRLTFSPAVLESGPKKSFVLKFPKFTLSLMIVGKDIYAEFLEGSSRETFKGSVEDDEKEFQKIVDDVMKKLGTVIHVNHKK